MTVYVETDNISLVNFNGTKRIFSMLIKNNRKQV